MDTMAVRLTHYHAFYLRNGEYSSDPWREPYGQSDCEGKPNVPSGTWPELAREKISQGMVRTKQTAKKSAPAPSKLRKLEAKRHSLSKKSTPRKEESIKKRRFKPGQRALQQIRKLQRTTELLMPRAPFMRLVREIARQVAPNHNDLRFQSAAISALQVFCILVLKYRGKPYFSESTRTSHRCQSVLAFQPLPLLHPPHSLLFLTPNISAVEHRFCTNLLFFLSRMP
ncbi:Histone H3 [Toxocara canis]|uniref:Histone H3 n=1 Tax=Toxocara canis TaxID=6265 RepID=A0A0B2VVW3_TOXCA|nr:Histone H3 [Toxocara canis]